MILMKIENVSEIKTSVATSNSNIIDGTAHLNCFTKTIEFNFNGEIFSVNLLDGDLEDSWSTITTKDGSIYDGNFHWENDDEKPRFGVYFIADSFENIPQDIQLGSYINFDIVEIIGNIGDYFEKGNDDSIDAILIEKAKETLRKAGYYVDNLWSVNDVKSNRKTENGDEVSNELAMEILDKALNNDATMDQIWFAINDFSIDNGLVKIEE